MNHAFSNLTLPALRPFESIGMCLVIHHRLINFFLSVKDERSVLDNFLIEGKTGYENCFAVLVNASP